MDQAFGTALSHGVANWMAHTKDDGSVVVSASVQGVMLPDLSADDASDLAHMLWAAAEKAWHIERASGVF